MARSRTTTLTGAFVSTALLAAVPVGTLQADGDDHKQRNFRIKLSPFQEVPAVSSGAKGEFRLRINKDETEMRYTLSYSGTMGPVTQAHIHFGQKDVNGGITVFLCTNLGNGPAGTQPCPPEGTITGTIVATSVVAGASAQGIAASELAELVTAIRAGVTYANVHSTIFGGGEIRGQIR